MGAYISPFREGDDAMTKPRKQPREYHRMPEARRLYGNNAPLAKSTLRALKALARNECANCYDDGRQCVMTDKPCFQINASGVACEYFKQCVLPLDKELYATLIQRTSLRIARAAETTFFLPTTAKSIAPIAEPSNAKRRPLNGCESAAKSWRRKTGVSRNALGLQEALCRRRFQSRFREVR